MRTESDNGNILYQFKVEKEAPLLEFLYDVLKQQSKSNVKGYLRRGQVTVDSKVVTAFDWSLHKGERVTILRKGEKGKSVMPLKGIKVIYEDRYLIVIVKDAGVRTMAMKGGDINNGTPTAFSLVSTYLRRDNPYSKAYVVHRLDQKTSGVLMFAKDEKTKDMLRDNWDKFIKDRCYVAVLEGVPSQSEGRIESWLTENQQTRKVYSSYTDNGGKRAITNYEVVDTRNGYSFVVFHLETGRKNQIRVHASSCLGCPVAGDVKYGAVSDPIGRLALHARAITFRHPYSGKIMTFDTGAPSWWKSEK